MSRPKQGVVVRFCAAGCFLLLACSSGSQSNAADAGDYLYVWTASVDSTQPDFLAVIDLAEDSGRSGRLVTTLPVPGRRNVPHHTEHEMPADRQLFANGFATGQSFIIDLTDPATPKLAAQFGDVAGMSHPHSYLRLPSGNVLTTFQNRHEGNTIAPGGLAEMTPTGQTVRAASAQGPGVHPGTRPYSAVVMPAIDRIVSTTSDMHADSPASAYLQIWRLSDLTLLNTVPLPNGPLGDEALLTAEPRLLPDGKRLLVSTFNCALYLVEDLDRATPTSRLVASFPRMAGEYCAIPVIVGSYYLITVPAWRAVVSLDISDPAAPRGRSTHPRYERRAALDRRVARPAARRGDRERRDETSGRDGSVRPSDWHTHARRRVSQHRPGSRRIQHGRSTVAPWHRRPRCAPRRRVCPALSVRAAIGSARAELRPAGHGEAGRATSGSGTAPPFGGPVRRSQPSGPQNRHRRC